MAKDAKLPEIEIKRDDFNTELQAEIATQMVQHWDKEGPTDYSELSEIYGSATSSQYGKVMNEYLGPVDHDLTVEEIRARYGSVTEYLEKRKADEVETDTRQMTEREFEMFQEGYQLGDENGFDRGWDKALKMAKRKGAENVPRMTNEN